MPRHGRGASPYLAAEDSALLRRALRPYSGDACLEIGAGNAGNLVDLSSRFRLTVGTDLQPPGMSDWKESGADFLLADCASCLRSASFDLVTFNPPYLRGPAAEDPKVAGGESLEVPGRFLAEALRTVKRSGDVVFLLNGEADIGEFESICSEAGFRLDRVMLERLFFEELSVYRARAVG